MKNQREQIFKEHWQSYLKLGLVPYPASKTYKGPTVPWKNRENGDPLLLPVEVLTVDVSDEKRELIVDELNAGRIKVLVATGQLIGGGFDCKGLSTLFLSTPIRFDGRLLQYLGRVLRPAPGKEKAKFYDYADSKVGVLKAAATARRRVYFATESK